MRDDELARVAQAPVSPAHFALRVSRGRWQAKRHLRVINRAIVRAATAEESTFTIVSVPPRHGKSELVSRYTPAWYEGTWPDRNVILTTYESELAMHWGREGRNLMAEHGEAVFGERLRSDSSAADRWGLEGRAGGMVAVGMGGALTGRGGHIIIIDDPVKGWAESQSLRYREAQWEWFQGTLRSRLEPGGSIIVVMTRWSEDDLAGRLTRMSEEDPKADQWETIRLPALAEAPAGAEPEWRDEVGRAPGEPLWPERYGEAELSQIRASVGPMVWEATFQQRPSSPEGGMFRVDAWRYVDEVPVGLDWIRRWDLAATSKSQARDDPDWTAGVLMARDPESGLVYIADVRRIQGEPLEVEQFIRSTAEEDYSRWGTRKQRMSQDPGQAGKALIGHYRRHVLVGFDFQADSESGDKLARATPLASLQAGHGVVLRRGRWTHEFVEEFRQFPNGTHDDQVDAAALAFQEVAGLLKRKTRIIV